MPAELATSLSGWAFTVTGQMFATMIGGDMVHVPFKGEGPALTELLGGRIDLFFGNISAVLKYREGKQVKLLGLASAKRGAMAPDVPSAGEVGLPDLSLRPGSQSPPHPARQRPSPTSSIPQSSTS